MIRSLIARGMAALALTLAAVASPALAQTGSSITVKDGTGTSQTVCTVTINSKQVYCFYPLDASGNPIVEASHADAVNILNGLSGVGITSSVLPTGAATSANQSTLNAYAGTLAGTVAASGTPAPNAQTVQPGTGSKFDGVVQGTATNIGANVTAATATTLTAANTARRGFAIQNQTGGSCYLSSVATATADFNSLLIAAGSYYVSSDSHVGTGALSIICNAAGGVYGRQW